MIASVLVIMSNFKIQYTHLSSNIQNRLIKLPLLELDLVPPSMSILTYEIEQLLEPIQAHFQTQTNFHLLTKAIKVLSNSLNHSSTFKKLEQIIQKYSADTPKMYEFISIWAKTAASSLAILRRLSPNLRTKITNIIFTCYFLRFGSNNSNIGDELSLMLRLSKAQQILAALKKSYQSQGKPLSIAITKSMSVKTQRTELRNLIYSFLQFAIQNSERKVAEMIQKVQEYPQLLSLVQEVPSTTNILLKYIKKTINQENVLQIMDKNTFSTLTSPAIKEWLEEQPNYWKLVDKQFSRPDTKVKIVQIGKMISQQGLVNKSLSVKYLYDYFLGKSFDFQVEDQLILKTKNHQQWMQVYKGITLCQSFQNFNLITLNVSSGVKHWNLSDPFEVKTNSKGLNKLIEAYTQFYDQTRKKYLNNNKKLAIAYSSFYVRASGQDWKWVSFQQLKSFLDQAKSLENYSFKDQYPAFQKKSSLPVKQQSSKDHNIVVEAKLVRLLKRNKQNVSKEWLVTQTGYATQIVEAGLKRLCNKGIVELDESKMIYNYIP